MTIIPPSAEKDIQGILKPLFPLATPQEWGKKWKLIQMESQMTIVADKKTEKKSLVIKTENPEIKEIVNSLEIGQHLARLPDESVRTIAYTNALEWEWHRRRTRNHWVARLFVANRLCFDSQPFVDTARTELGKLGYEMACAYADLLGKKWELIDAAHPQLKKFFSQSGDTSGSCSISEYGYALLCHGMPQAQKGDLQGTWKCFRSTEEYSQWEDQRVRLEAQIKPAPQISLTFCAPGEEPFEINEENSEKFEGW
jgi:hypothetical protein